VERLEDRVLLSAEPMVQQSRLEEQEPLAATNVTLEVGARQSERPSIDDLSRGALRIDLTKGVSQSSQLASGGGRLLELNNAPTNLIIDLGAGDDQVQLTQQADGRLKLAGSAELYELLFAKPTGALGIRGLDGVDKVVLDSLVLETASLLVESESISLAGGKALNVGGNVLLRAEHTFDADELDDESVSLGASVLIDGSIKSGGAVVLQSSVAANVALESTGVLANLAIDATTSAVARIGSGSVITAGSLEVIALTDNRLSAQAEGGFGLIDVRSMQTTSAVIAGGARLIIDAQDDGDGI
jgi:hypothetical protein